MPNNIGFYFTICNNLHSVNYCFPLASTTCEIKQSTHIIRVPFNRSMVVYIFWYSERITYFESGYLSISVKLNFLRNFPNHEFFCSCPMLSVKLINVAGNSLTLSCVRNFQHSESLVVLMQSPCFYPSSLSCNIQSPFWIFQLLRKFLVSLLSFRPAWWAK